MGPIKEWQFGHAIFIFIGALVLGVWHGLSKGVDATTVGLLLLAAFAPYLHRIKEIELPGGGKVSLEETQEAEQDAQEAQESEKQEPVKQKLKETVEKGESEGYGWRLRGGRQQLEAEGEQSTTLIDRAYNLVYFRPKEAMGILQKALEKGIAQLYGAVPGPGREEDIKTRGIMGIAKDLQREGIITAKTFESIRDVFSLTTRVKHGQKIDLVQAERMMDAGNNVVGILKTKVHEALAFRKII